MKITHQNFMQELNNCVTELLLIVDELKKIETDTPANHDYMQQLNGRFVLGTLHLPEIMQFIAKSKPDPKIVGNKLKAAINLCADVITEKTRIAKNTPMIYRQTNDETGPN